jgi:HlyD family secretion protein
MTKRRYLLYLAGGLVALGGFAAWSLHLGSPKITPDGSASAKAPDPAAHSDSSGPVGCLGRFTPVDDVIRIAAPYYQSRPSLVATLYVREGEWVRGGQVIGCLDGKPQVEAERARVAAELQLAIVRSAQVRAGAKASDVEAQRAELARLQAEYRLRESDFKRYEKLAEKQEISVADLDARRTALEMAERAVDSAQQHVTAMNEVRAEDVRVADAEVEVARNRLGEIDARLAALTVKAPAAGRVIKIHAHAGEEAGPQGILEIANTRAMAVEAEVYASDIAKVRAGQRAVIEMEEGGPKLNGTVTRVGERVQQAAVLPGDPTSYADAHVVPVRIRVDGCDERACPIFARVKVMIGGAQ